MRCCDSYGDECKYEEPILPNINFKVCVKWSVVTNDLKRAEKIVEMLRENFPKIKINGVTHYPKNQFTSFGSVTLASFNNSIVSAPAATLMYKDLDFATASRVMSDWRGRIEIEYEALAVTQINVATIPELRKKIKEVKAKFDKWSIVND